MKAIICHSFGLPDQLIYTDVPEPVPGNNELLVSVKACGVNFPDVLIIQNLYQVKPELPFSPGADIAGIVESVGPDVKNYKVGDEVISMSTFGGFAEKAVVSANTSFHKPKEMPMINAASFLVAYGTSYHALKDRAKLKKDEVLLVLGASGGVGLSAVEIGKLMGAKVIAAASTDEKLEICKKYGADELINYSKEDLKTRIKEIVGNKGVDVVYDPLGGQFSEIALRTLGWKGRHLVIGFASGEISKMPLNLALLKGCDILGVFWGSFTQKEPKLNLENTMQLINWFKNGTLNPHIHKVYPLKDGAQALADMMNRKVKGKAVVSME